MSQVTVLENMDASRFIESLLASSPTISRFTAMVHLKMGRDGNGMVGTKYAWAHQKMRPWGQELPVQCSKCFSLRCFTQFKAGNADVHKFVCKGLNTDGTACRDVLEFRAPDNMKRVPKSHWISSTWPDTLGQMEVEAPADKVDSGSEYQGSD
jgi:hypothetical protein